MILRIRNWNERYENHRSRELKRLDFVLVPTGMDTDGYTALMDHPNAAAHLGAWIALLQIAARCSTRGTLVNSDGRPHTCHSLARISRIPAKIFEELIPRLLSEDIFWLEDLTPVDATQREIARENATNARESATPIVLFPSIPVEVVSDSENARAREETALEVSAVPILEECREIYKQAGAPIPAGHEQRIVQYLVGIPPEKRKRVAAYCRWALWSGKWPNPGKTKALLRVLSDGDWDVELTMRTLPEARAAPAKSKREQATDIAFEKFLKDKGLDASSTSQA